MVSQAWTDWVLVSPVVYSSSSLVGLAQLQALLNAAQGLYPTSPHVHMAQQVMTTRQPSAPPQPPFPPVPGMRQPTMPRHSITPAPGSQTAPRRLNEFTYRTPTAPPHIDHQPGGLHHAPPSTESRTLTDVRQMNPFMQPSSAAPPQLEQTQIPGSRSARSLQQFLQSPAAATGTPPAMQSPMPRHLPPAMNQIRPSPFQQAPHIPHQIAPRGFGDGRHNGGGGQGGGGGHSGHGGSGGHRR
jgi:hypothetical protein